MLTASEVGEFVFCFVPMLPGPPRALLEVLRSGAFFQLPLGGYADRRSMSPDDRHGFFPD
jgi:hypothetical protein